MKIQDVDITIEKREDGNVFIGLYQGECHDQQCVQLFTKSREDLEELRDKINNVLESL